MSEAGTDTAKAQLRLALRCARRAAAQAAPQAAHQAAAHLPEAFLGRFPVVAGYHPQGAELDPFPLLERLIAAGARGCLPFAPARDAPLAFRAFIPGQPASETDAFGLPAPRADAELLVPELVIVPLLGFDRRGARLGQGAGCYDRTLADLRARGLVFALGLAYAAQETGAAPCEAHDQLLDAILTEKAYIPVEKDI